MSKQPTNAPYQPPVAKLLTLGECKLTKVEHWIDYCKTCQLTVADIPELIRMMTDIDLWESEESGELWSVVHAWRALGQLKAVEAIAPLLPLWNDYEDDDWLNNEAPSVFELIGTDALPVLSESLADTSLNEWARSAITEGIVRINGAEPECRDACVEILRRQLEDYNDNSSILNGVLVAAMLELKAVEVVDLIEQVYAAKKIDDMIPGTWATAQIELGLKQESDFTSKELQPQFFRNLQAARLITNPQFNNVDDDENDLNPDWYEPPHPVTSIQEVLQIPKQLLKPKQGFGQEISDSTKGNKKKKKK